MYVIMGRVRLTIFTVEKAINITFSEYLRIALGIRHGKRMRCIILSSVACLNRLYFFTLSHKRTTSGENLLNIGCELIPSMTFV